MDIPIREIALITREAHMRSMAIMGYSQTDGSCLLGSIFLRETLIKFSGMPRVLIRGGGGGDGGFRARDGVLHGHYWIETSDGAHSWVIDITADQFGEEPVRVLALDQATQYIPGDQDEVDRHVADVLQQALIDFRKGIA